MGLEDVSREVIAGSTLAEGLWLEISGKCPQVHFVTGPPQPLAAIAARHRAYVRRAWNRTADRSRNLNTTRLCNRNSRTH
jgi:hypothetical protein